MTPIRATLAGLLALALLPLSSSAHAAADESGPSSRSVAPASLADAVLGLPDVDLRGSVLPTAAQRTAAARLGAVDVRWNSLGTPTSILPKSGVLASGYATDPTQAPAAARDWLAKNAAVFGLSAGQVGDLELVNNQELAGSPARAVLFRQRYGGLVPALDGMVTVGVSAGKIAYVSSSITKVANVPADPVLTPLQGWLKAAADVGHVVLPADLAAVVATISDGWTRLKVPGLAVQQQARIRALAMADGTVRPVVEANVVDVAGGAASAYTVLVDAVNGVVLHRQNQVDTFEDSEVFTGSITPADCGPKHAFSLPDAATKSITALAAAAPYNDIVIKLFGPGDTLIATGDLLTSPEALTATNALGFPAGSYSLQVCPFPTPTTPILPPYNYVATVVTSNSTTPTVSLGDPRWRFFEANPAPASANDASTPTNSVVGCWFAGSAACSYSLGAIANVQAPGPWDTLAATGTTTATTIGNNANTHEAWANPLAPGGLVQAPVSILRDYTQPFTDAWNNSRCNPLQLIPGGNDVNQVVANLFTTHNFMHDYAYYLGFTEANYNLQLQNLGRGGTEGDPEIGNAQAGALTGGQPTFLGRDNANQIALQDGIPGITNQYLFQPFAGSFYAPCTDGSLDFGIVGHEYTHAISNRMIGGPDEGITSEQGGAMGESWSDLNAAEYQFSHGFSNGGNIWAVGVYATGNKETAIRDYAINANPLNYSDYGFDTTGPEVHADGEIWNGTQWSVRQALVDLWNKQFKYADTALQRSCSVATATTSPLPASSCPGNRRWIQLVFDAFLLQQGATSMLDARDAMIAADQLRFGGADRKALWQAFASRGMGAGASIKNADDTDPVPSFATPKGAGKNVKVTFKGKGSGKVYVGDYEARATPVADLVRSTPLAKSVRMTPGTYRMVYVSPKRGFTRFTLKVHTVRKHGGRNHRHGRKQLVHLKTSKNFAAAASGAKVIAATAGSRNPAFLLDGTESTNWGGVTADNVDLSHPFVAVDLSGSKPKRVKRVNVSAYLTPAPPGPLDDIPLADDPDSGSRFTALRQFAIDVCRKDCAAASASWHRVFTSSADAFPSVLPRPVAPTLNLRSFRIGRKHGVQATAVRLVVLENQCTGFAGYAGEQDDDPLNDTDCKTATDRGTIVHAAELQVFGGPKAHHR
jgi:extracellular elastinolytic metalloproteinase